MKFLLALLIFLGGACCIVKGQNPEADRLKLSLQKAPHDTDYVHLLLATAEIYFFSNPDSCLLYSLQALDLARQLHYTRGKVMALNKAGEKTIEA